MTQTRREFLIVSTAALSLAAVVPEIVASTPPIPSEPAWIHGDPYIATTCDGGLGGLDFDSARERALRFRMPDSERDRLLLGLEIF